MMYTFKVVDGDVTRNPATGLYTTITDKAKVEQDVKMCLSTDIRRIIKIGCGLDEAIGRDAKDPTSSVSFNPVMLEFQILVQNGLERLRRAQRSFHFSQRSAKELIYAVSPVQSWPDLQDVRIIRWKVDIETVDGTFPVSGRLRG